MSVFAVLRQFGTLALLRFTLALVLFLTLHLARIPLVLTARVLEIALYRIDRYATRHATQRPARPVNDFYRDHTTTNPGGEEAHPAYA
jgi:hypothetical protein